MLVPKELFVDLEEKFGKVKNLLENSGSDPETAPYTSKYAARQHLESMNKLLDTLMIQNDTNNQMCNKIIGMVGAIQLQLGNIAVDTEELSQGEKHYEECQQLIESHKYEMEVASVTFNLHNQLGILWLRRDTDKGLSYLHQAESFYKELKEREIVPIYYMDLFDAQYEYCKDDALAKHERAFTHTLFYMAQGYVTVNTLRSAIYCHQTLQRMYDCNEYDYIDWILNAATLSQCLMQHNGFKQARHHLCASLFMIDKYKTHLDACPGEGEEHEAKIETLRHRSADVARCWIKYCLNLLSNSKDRLLRTENIDDTQSNCTDLANMTFDEQQDITKEEFENFQFKNIDLSSYEAEVTDQFVLTIEDAKKVYVYALRWIKLTLDYHTLNTHASDHLEITQDHCQFYDYLAFFEEDPELQCKMYKRGIDLLESVESAVNPTYYLKYCRELWFRIATLSSDIMEIKLEKVRNSKSAPTVNQRNKINTLVDKAVHFFTKFTDSFRNASGNLPMKINGIEEKYFLQAQFNLAAIQSRYCASDPEVLVERVNKGIEMYQAMLNYCKANESARELVKGELEVAEIMVPLLQLKITRINI